MRVWFKDRPVKQRAAVISAGSALISSGLRLHQQVTETVTVTEPVMDAC